MITSKIEGMKEALAGIEGSPERLQKILRKAFQEGGKAASRSVRQRTPKRWRKLVRYKIEKAITGDSSALVGYYNNSRGTRGKRDDMPDWFKAYWKNYGTLKHRDPNHDFDYPIKPNVKRRNDEGQEPENFFEAAMERMEDAFIEAAEKVLLANKDEILL